MDFEDILSDVGGFGMYQKILVAAFLVPSYIAIPMLSMNSIFYAITPDHWCYVAEVAHSNLSLEMQQELIRPPTDHSCSMYDVDYGKILKTGNISIDPFSPTKPCDNGWQYDTSEYDETSVTKWDMVCDRAHYGSLMLSLIFIGDVVGTPFYGFLSDRWGRKPTFLFMALVIALSDIGSMLSPSFTLFLILRGVNGTAMSTVYSVGYIILLELVQPEMRTRMNGISTTSWTFGLCLLPLVAYLTRSWVKLCIVTTVLAASLLLYWKILPESPSWLISRERYEEAAEIMKKISKSNGKTAHEGNQLLQKIQRLGEKTKKERVGEVKSSPMDFFKYPTLRKRFLLVTICWVGNSIPYFGLQMNVVNLSGSEFFNFFLISLVEVPAHIATWIFMVRVGRRWCSVGAFILSAISCMLPVIFPPEYANVGVIASLLAKAGSSSAFMTLYQQGPELFPTDLRGIGLGMATTIGTGSTLIVPYIVHLAEYGTYIPFLSFAIIGAISAVCASFLPETLNKKLPQTVDEAENFEKDQKFFSCGTQEEEEEEEEREPPSTWSQRTLSAIDLTSSLKDYSDAVNGKQSSYSSCVNVDAPTIMYSPTNKNDLNTKKF